MLLGLGCTLRDWSFGGILELIGIMGFRGLGDGFGMFAPGFSYLCLECLFGMAAMVVGFAYHFLPNSHFY